MNETRSKKGLGRILCSTALGTLILAAILTLPAINAQSRSMPGTATTAQREVTWLGSIQTSCLNSTFCSKTGGLNSLVQTLTLFSDHTGSLQAIGIGYDNSSAIVFRIVVHFSIEKWKTAPGHNANSTDFYIVEGLNRTTIYTNGRQMTGSSELHNYDTRFPVMQGSWDCPKLVAMGTIPGPCAEDTVFYLAVTRVS